MSRILFEFFDSTIVLTTGTADGTSTADSTITGLLDTAGTADGTSTADSTITGLLDTAGTADGTSTADSTISGITAGSTGTSDGTSTADATITGLAYTTGTADGTSTAIAYTECTYTTLPLESVLTAYLETLFAAPPDTTVLCARAWADAMREYTLTTVPPPPTASAAADVLATTLVPIFENFTSASPEPLIAATTAAALEDAWYTFADSLGCPMASPSGLVGFLPLFETPVLPATHHEAAVNFASSIHLWMLTSLDH
jgi:hypothetical protein